MTGQAATSTSKISMPLTALGVPNRHIMNRATHCPDITVPIRMNHRGSFGNVPDVVCMPLNEAWPAWPSEIDGCSKFCRRLRSITKNTWEAPQPLNQLPNLETKNLVTPEFLEAKILDPTSVNPKSYSHTSAVVTAHTMGATQLWLILLWPILLWPILLWPILLGPILLWPI